MSSPRPILVNPLSAAGGYSDISWLGPRRFASGPEPITLATQRPDVARGRRRETAMVINLNQYRRKRQRAEAEARAAENRTRFGRSKEVRTKELRERERARREIEDKRLD